MNKITKPKIYREMIDKLVDMCHNGQGNIGATRAMIGIWNSNARPDYLEDQYKINLLLSRLNKDEKKVLAELLSQEVITGVFETLKILEEYQIDFFRDGYEGSPYNDFIGRVDKNDPWKWPE